MISRLFVFFVLILFVSCNNHVEPSSDSGSVASAHPIATKAGLDILNNGGNAFDAAIAIASTLNVVEPMMSGIGGYGTILIYDAKKKEIRYLNPSGRFPAKTNTDLMREPTPDFMKNRFGPKSISTPGNLNAWEAMHDTYGSLAWNELFSSAINWAHEGFTISSNTANWINRAFPDFSNYSKSFYGKEGNPLQEGDKLIQSDLAETFQLISEKGVDPFYHGTIADAIHQKMEEVGSFLSKKDLEENEAEWWEPIRMNYRGYDVYTAGLPANAFAAFVNLGLMREFQADQLGYNSSEYLHLLAEMTKESYKARLAYSFDPEVKEAPLDSLFSPDVLKSMAESIDKNQATVFKPPFSEESKNTTHFVVVDQWGNIVSATQTLGNLFGSRVMVEGTGIWLNNSMAYSTFEPKGNPMDAFAGRHKLSGDCPVIILKNDEPWAALGSPGGHTITQNVPQIIFNLIDFGMSMQEAINAPKISFIEPDFIRAEGEIPGNIIQSLQSMGHKIKKGSIGNAMGIKLIKDKAGLKFDVGIDHRGEGNKAIIDH